MMLSTSSSDGKWTEVASEHLPDHRSSPLHAPSKNPHTLHPRRPLKFRSNRRSTDDSRPDLVTRLLTQESELRRTKSNLVVAYEQIQKESTRADAAEHRALEYSNHLRNALETRRQVDQQVAKLREQVGMYHLQFENAQNEILRAQEVLAKVSSQRDEAEAEATRLRSILRKIREERAVARAREEGRRQGFDEGFPIGRKMGHSESREDQDNAPLVSTLRPSRTQYMAPVDDYREREQQQEVRREERRLLFPRPLSHSHATRAQPIRSRSLPLPRMDYYLPSTIPVIPLARSESPPTEAPVSQVGIPPPGFLTGASPASEEQESIQPQTSPSSSSDSTTQTLRPNRTNSPPQTFHISESRPPTNGPLPPQEVEQPTPESVPLDVQDSRRSSRAMISSPHATATHSREVPLSRPQSRDLISQTMQYTSEWTDSPSGIVTSPEHTPLPPVHDDHQPYQTRARQQHQRQVVTNQVQREVHDTVPPTPSTPRQPETVLHAQTQARTQAQTQTGLPRETTIRQSSTGEMQVDVTYPPQTSRRGPRQDSYMNANTNQRGLNTQRETDGDRAIDADREEDPVHVTVNVAVRMKPPPPKRNANDRRLE